MSSEVIHGGRLDSAISKYGGSYRTWLDMSTGINPDPYRVRGISSNSWTRLPDSLKESECRRAAGRAYGVGSDAHISISGGSQSHIQLLPTLFKAQSVSIVGYTYPEHYHCWKRSGHEIFISDGLDSALSSSRIVIVVNPNNPDGRLYSPDELLDLSRALNRRSGVLIVDEAFGDLSPEHSVASHTGLSSLIVLRSFGKFYGLGGIRLGFALSDKSLGRKLDESLGPWNVSGPALSVGTMALSDRRWQARARKRLSRMRTDLESLLTRYGFSIVGGTDLFVLTQHPRAGSLAEHLLRSHILVRQFPERTQWLRFGMVKKSSLGRLEKALSSFTN